MTVPFTVSHMDSIAIIGMSGRFPGAGSVEAFWENLASGVESISRFSDAELEMRPPPDAGAAFVNARGVRARTRTCSTRAFFNFNAREAELLDPQHRVFLECAWEALESAGYDPERYPGLIGVWAGSGINSYLLYNIGTGHDFFARLVGGYQQGESGRAVQQRPGFPRHARLLQAQPQGPEPDRADGVLDLAGRRGAGVPGACGVTRRTWRWRAGCRSRFRNGAATFTRKAAIASADGHTRTFDAAAQGTVFSSGAGVVLLKRLEDAHGGRRPHRGGHQGRGGQQRRRGQGEFHRAERRTGRRRSSRWRRRSRACRRSTISYVEAHGTGTPLGDPIEVAALTQAFRAGGATGNGISARSVRSRQTWVTWTSRRAWRRSSRPRWR